MRVIITGLFLCLSFGLSAQKPDMKKLDKAVNDFDKALLKKDSLELKRLLNEQLVYGHSNGWMQTKKEVIADLYNGKLTYRKIAPGNEQIKIDGVTAAVREEAEVEVEMEGKPISLKLKVLQVWVWGKGSWELFARQSIKM